MGDRGEREAFVTLATNDTYALGCLVLGNSLRRVGTTRQLVVMVTNGVSQSMRNQLESVFNLIYEVNLLDSQDERNLTLLGRPDLNVTFTKLHCWRLTQFQKCVFLDADTLVLQNCDELFDREELSASPDAGWPDCFNSGVFVFQPSEDTYTDLLNFAVTRGSFDGGDQGLLNLYFNSWPTKDIAKHLPFIYNVVSQAFYSYLPAFTEFRDKIKIVHFIGAIKPWHHPYNTATKTVSTFPETGHCQEFLQMWWNLFMESVQPRLDPTLGGLVGELAQMKIQPDGSDFIILDDRERRLAWERGQADYLGADSFENIRRKLDQKMVLPPSSSKVEASASEPVVSKPSGEVNGIAAEVVSDTAFVQAASPISVISDSQLIDVTPPHTLSEKQEEAVLVDLAPPPELGPVDIPAPVPVPVPEPGLDPAVVSASLPLGSPVASIRGDQLHVSSGSPADTFSAPPTVFVAQSDSVTETSVSLSSPTVASSHIQSTPVAQATAEEEESTFTVSLSSFAPAPVPESIVSPAVAQAPVSLSSPVAPAPISKPPPVSESKPAASTFAPVTPAPLSSPAPLSKPAAPVASPAGKPQEKLTPLKIGPKVPPPTPEKPTSPLGSAGVKSPPPISQKPTSPLSPTSLSGAKPPPPVPAKPATPPVATGVAAQRGMFEKPAAAPKPASPRGVGVSAFAARFQQPPTASAPATLPPGPSAPKPSTPTAPSPRSPTSPSSQTQKNEEFLARFGLKKK